MASYKERTRRITFDVPIMLKALIHSIIPPSRLSAIMRLVLKEIINLEKREGKDKALAALINNNIIIMIKPQCYKELEQWENNNES